MCAVGWYTPRGPALIWITTHCQCVAKQFSMLTKNYLILAFLIFSIVLSWGWVAVFVVHLCWWPLWRDHHLLSGEALMRLSLVLQKADINNQCWGQYVSQSLCLSGEIYSLYTLLDLREWKAFYTSFVALLYITRDVSF